MKRLFTTIAALAGILTFLFMFNNPVHAQLLITEIMPDPAASQDTSEWVEIYNYSPFEIPLNQVLVNDKTINALTNTIPPNETLVVTKNLQSFQTEFGNLEAATAAISLANGGGNVSLKLNNKVIDTFSYLSATANKSWQRGGPLCNPAGWETISPSVFVVSPGCWPSDEQQPAVVEVTTNSNGNRHLIGPETITITGWSQQDNYNYGDIVNGFILNEEVTLFSYNNHQLTKYKSETITSLPVLNIDYVISESGELSQIKLTPIGIIDTEIIENIKIIIGNINLELNNYLFKPTENTIELKPSIQLECLINVCIPGYAVTLNGGEWERGEFAYSFVVNSVNSTTSNSASSSSVTSNASVVLKTVEISEVYAAPKSEEHEWVELYNFGPTQIELNGWYIQDARGKHMLSGVISSGEYKVIADLKITLNNSGETLELISPHGDLVESWEQPAVGSGIAAAKKLGKDRHESKIYLVEAGTPGKENEIIETNMNALSLGSGVSSTSVPVVTTHSIITNNFIAGAELKTPDLKIKDFSNIGLPPDPIDITWQMAILALISLVQFLLVVKVIWRIPAVNTNIKFFAKNMYQQVKRFVLGPNALDRKDKRMNNLEVLRY